MTLTHNSYTQKLVSEIPRFGILGGGKFPALGGFSDYIKVERSQVIEVPNHLEDHHAAAWPLAGVTAWRFVHSTLKSRPTYICVLISMFISKNQGLFQFMVISKKAKTFLSQESVVE